MIKKCYPSEPNRNGGKTCTSLIWELIKQIFCTESMSQRTLLYAPRCKNNRFFSRPDLSRHQREAMPDCVLFLGRIEHNELSFRQYPHYL